MTNRRWLRAGLILMGVAFGALAASCAPARPAPLLSPLPDRVWRVYLPSVALSVPVTPLTYGPQGIGDANQNNGNVNLDALKFDWYYDWMFWNIAERNADPRFVRMVWCAGMTQPDVDGVTHTVTETAQLDYRNGYRGRVWLVYNEPDILGGECARQLGGPAAAAQRYSTIYTAITGNDPSARVLCCGLVFLNRAATRDWWTTFVATLRAEGHLDQLTGVHVHLYPGAASDPAPCAEPICVAEAFEAARDWYAAMHVGQGLAGRPIWISESGWLDCRKQANPAWVRDTLMRPIAEWFNGPGNPGYAALAWYVTRDPGWHPCAYLLDAGRTAQPTALGQAWNQIVLVGPQPSTSRR